MAGLLESLALAAETIGGAPGCRLDHHGHAALEHDLDVHVHVMNIAEEH
jgi:hypothetical protein